MSQSCPAPSPLKEGSFQERLQRFLQRDPEALDLPLKESWLRAALVLYFVGLVLVIVIDANMISYPVFLLSFFVLAAGITRFSFFRKLQTLSGWHLFLALFLIAFLLRASMFIKGTLLPDQIVTEDILYYQARTGYMEDGQVPFRDFNPKHPPLYPLTLYALGSPTGNSLLSYRFAFSLIDSIVVVVVYKLILQVYDERHALYAALLYAISPLNIVAVGLSGHYDPIVSFFVLLGIIAYLQDQKNKAAFLLGIGFAYKYYSLVLLPFLIWKMDNWKKQTAFILLFFLPMLLSLIPFIIITPAGVYEYFFDQGTGWNILYSYAFGFKWVFFEPTDLLLGRFTGLVMFFFMGSLIVLFLSWVNWREYKGIWQKPIDWFLGLVDRKSEEAVKESGAGGQLALALKGFIDTPPQRKLIFVHWFILVCYFLLFGFLVAAAPNYLKYHDNNPHISHPMVFTILGAAVYSAVAILVYRFIRPLIYGPCLFDFNFTDYQKEELFLAFSFAIILLLFIPPDYCGWYLIWLLPFILGIRTRTIRYSLLVFSLWIVG